ncbi:DoxX family protein [Chitinophaga sp. RAB17]|uniref:DoxX family protein n=1 Tax=Chitinophaga sp. RAB17 TaxID=3233049 RepID=UPI003F8FC18A
MKKYQDLAVLLLRVATAVNFLSAVAIRFGLWGAEKGNWTEFVIYTGKVNSFAPTAIIPFLAVSATALEILFAILLLVGYKTRWVAMGAAILTLIFALSMTYSFGALSALTYAVWVDCTSALLLATMPYYRWSLDEKLAVTKTIE